MTNVFVRNTRLSFMPMRCINHFDTSDWCSFPSLLIVSTSPTSAQLLYLVSALFSPGLKPHPSILWASNCEIREWKKICSVSKSRSTLDACVLKADLSCPEGHFLQKIASKYTFYYFIVVCCCVFNIILKWLKKKKSIDESIMRLGLVNNVKINNKQVKIISKSIIIMK